MRACVREFSYFCSLKVRNMTRLRLSATCRAQIEGVRLPSRKKSWRLVAVILALLCAMAGAQAKVIRVGVFLPFMQEGKKHVVTEYYRGLLMAVDSLSKTTPTNGESTTFNITAADCGNTATDMLALLDESKNGVFQIIFAPSNQNQLKVLDNYSRLNGTKICVPFGGRYDEWITNPAFFALNVTQTDMAVPAYKLITEALRARDIYIIDTHDGKNYCPLANYVKKYVKGAKVMEYPKKEKKILKLMGESNALLIPSSYDEKAQEALIQMSRQTNGVKAAIIGYPAWYERANTARTNKSQEANTAPNGGNSDMSAKTLGQLNAYVIQPSYPLTTLPRVKHFAANYKANFDASLPQEPFSYALWGFDTGYYLLKGLMRYGQDFNTQPLYAAPLQTKIRFSERAGGQGYINTAVLLLHYRQDGQIDIIQPKE